MKFLNYKEEGLAIILDKIESIRKKSDTTIEIIGISGTIYEIKEIYFDNLLEKIGKAWLQNTCPSRKNDKN